MLAFSFSASYSQVETKFFEKKNATASLKRLSAIKQANTAEVCSLPSKMVDMKIRYFTEANKDNENRYGVPIDVSYTLSNGRWSSTDDGRLWSMNFHSDNAESLTFYFSNLYLPKGAELYIVNKDETISYGPVNHDALTEKGHYLSDIIPGSDATIYLYEPSGVEGQSIMELSRIIHGCSDFEKNRVKAQTRGVTINYPQSVACYPAWTNTSDGVGTIIFSDGTYANGALLMDARYTFAPYLLFNLKSIHTANNSDLTSAEIVKVCTMAVKFRAREISCGSSTQMTSYTYNGAYLKSWWHETSFALAYIMQDVKQQKNITWLGWDLSGNAPCQGTWIGKYGSYYSALSYTINGISTSQNPFSNKYEWNAVEDWYTVGVTTKGSPLFNTDKQVCGFYNDYITYGDGYYRYWFSKFSDSWSGGGQNNNRLSNHLDVMNFGFTSVNSCHPMSIEGPTSATGSAVYYIDNLPSDFTVDWCLPHDDYCNLHCLYENTPASNQCTVTPDSQHDMTEITLRAFLYRGSTFVNSLEKTITVNYGNTSNGIRKNIENLQVTNVGNIITAKIPQVGNNEKMVWTIDAYDASTGKNVFKKKVSEESCSIDAIDWKPGVYVVRVTSGKESFSEKVVIK